MTVFRSIRIEGGLLGPDTLDQLLKAELSGQKAADFGFDAHHKLTDEIASCFADARTLWGVFQNRLAKLPESDLATSLTRKMWMIPFLNLLGYSPHPNHCAYQVDGLNFAISHRADEAEDSPPLHIVGARQELGRLAPSGRPRLSPHALVQEFLNRTEHLWSIVTNGCILRLLRDSTFVRRQAYVEFDLVNIFEEQRFQDFVVLYRLLHRSRLPRTMADASECLLENYYSNSVEQGDRVRERLREGVEECIKILADGFLSHPDNTELRERVANSEEASGEWRMANGGEEASSEEKANSEWRIANSGEEANSEWGIANSGEEKSHSPQSDHSLFAIRHSLQSIHSPLSAQELYNQLLRLVYRFLFLLVSEDRGLISSDVLYLDHYGIARLRRKLDIREAYDEYDDLWQSLRVLWRVFNDEKLAGLLQLVPLNGDLFARQFLDDCTITNRDLLSAFYRLAWYKDEKSNWRRVNYAALDTEELGSVYESLLEYHPVLVSSSEYRKGNGWKFELLFGSERKTTGSYYTPPQLVNELIQSALEPVLQKRLEEARQMANSEWRVVFEPVKRSFYEHLQRLPRSGSLATGHAGRQTDLSAHPQLSSERTVRDDQSDASGSRLHPSQHSGGLGTPLHSGVHPLSASGQREQNRTGDPSAAERGSHTLHTGDDTAASDRTEYSRSSTPEAGAQPPTEKELAQCWAQTPFAIRYSLLAAQAILSIRVCDPACGSGHFLLAAARRLGKELARVRTGEDEPAPEELRKAIREVITHCIYGVDKNPLAVDLCRVALWLESHTSGRPLTFLNHRIRCGDSLVGVFDLEVLKQGIPDEAFKPLEGDDKVTAREMTRRNRDERKGQRGLFDWQPETATNDLTKASQDLDAVPDDTLEAVRQKEQLYRTIHESPLTARLREACDLWTAAFFQPLHPAQPAITTAAVFDRLAGQSIDQRVLAIAKAIAERERFFHWPLEFPEVFDRENSEWRMANGGEEQNHLPESSHSPSSFHSPFAIRHSPSSGFDVVLSNPPWERIKLQEQEFFAARDVRIANALNKAARTKLIQELKETNPALHREYEAALRSAASVSKFLRSSKRFLLTGRGDINTYAVFAELARNAICVQGRAGVIVPSGIATDDTTKFFFEDLVQSGSLESLFDFENRKKIFPAVDSRMKFALLTMRAVADGSQASAEFVFFALSVDDLRREEKRFTLTPEEIALLNPNTGNCPIFRTQADAELTKAIYRRVPILWREANSGEAVNSKLRIGNGVEEAQSHSLNPNPWRLSFKTLFDMANDSHHFRTAQELESEGYRREGNVFVMKASSEEKANSEWGIANSGEEANSEWRIANSGEEANSEWGIANSGEEANSEWRIANSVEEKSHSPQSDHSPFAIPHSLTPDHSPFAIPHSLQSIHSPQSSYRYLPLYEAKMLHQFDHRWATYEERIENGEWGIEARYVTEAEKTDPTFVVQPRYWVREDVVGDAIPKYPELLARALELNHQPSVQRVLCYWIAGHHLISGHKADAQKLLDFAASLDIERSLASELGRLSADEHAKCLAQDFPLTKDDIEVVTANVRSEPEEIARRLVERFSPKWFLGWRDICRSTDERTLIASAVPRVAVGNTFLLMFPRQHSPRLKLALLATLNSFVQDYAARQKVGGTHIKYNVFRQIPLLSPSSLENSVDWLALRVLELVYTAHDLAPLARDCGYDGLPFVWNEARRFELRCELDAAFFHLYLPSQANGEWRMANREWAVVDETPQQLEALKSYFPTPRDAVSYILDQFPIVRRKDEEKHGRYRTKERILEIYDEMLVAQRDGKPYQTRLPSVTE